MPIHQLTIVIEHFDLIMGISVASIELDFPNDLRYVGITPLC